MMKKESYLQYNILAELFKYPSAQLPQKIKECEEMLDKQYPDVLKVFRSFSNWVNTTPVYEREEVFTKTFHIQAICYLDLGYVIFGEDYKRGEFLVNMKSEQAKVGNDCGIELPDNLANVLTLMPKLKDDTVRNELAVMVLKPALQKMLDEFKTARMELKTKVLRKKHKAILQEGQLHGNIYQHALTTLLEVINEDFKNIHYEQPEGKQNSQTTGFEAAACGSCSFIDNKSLKSVRT
jgi:nitrate reductase assembly molybdenum cofactor insertion protein NarJ